MSQLVNKLYKTVVALVCWAIFVVMIIYIANYFTDLFYIVAISLITTYLLLWPIESLEKKLPVNLPKKRLVSTLFVFISFLIVTSSLLILLIKPISTQILDIYQGLPDDIAKLKNQSIEFIDRFHTQYKYNLPNVELEKDQLIRVKKIEKSMDESGDFTTKIETKFLEQLKEIAERGASVIPSLLLGTFRNILYLVLIMMLSFYFILSQNTFQLWVKGYLSNENACKFDTMSVQIHNLIISYLKGQTVLAIFSGVFMFIIYSVLGLKYALLLAFLIGLSQFVPILGPILAIAPAIIVAFVDNPLNAVLVLLIFIVFQAIKDNFLTPILLGKAVGLHPAIIIISIIIGEKIGGILGVVLAVPIAIIIEIVILTLYPNLKLVQDLEEETSV